MLTGIRGGVHARGSDVDSASNPLLRKPLFLELQAHRYVGVRAARRIGTRLKPPEFPIVDIFGRNLVRHPSEGDQTVLLQSWPAHPSRTQCVGQKKAPPLRARPVRLCGLVGTGTTMDVYIAIEMTPMLKSGQASRLSHTKRMPKIVTACGLAA